MQNLNFLLMLPPNAVGSLATVDADRPRVRSMAIRKITPDGEIYMTAHAHSAKVEQLRHNPNAELVFWLSEQRQDYRLTGKISLHSGDALAVETWAGMSPESGSLYGPSTAATPPESFQLLIFHPTQVDHIDMSQLPPRATRYRAVTGWTPEKL